MFPRGIVYISLEKSIKLPYCIFLLLITDSLFNESFIFFYTFLLISTTIIAMLTGLKRPGKSVTYTAWSVACVRSVVGVIKICKVMSTTDVLAPTFMIFFTVRGYPNSACRSGIGS